MLGQPDFGFTKGLFLIAHQAQDGEQLQLLKAMFGNFAAVGWQRRLANTQRDSGKDDQSDVGYRAHLLQKTYAMNEDVNRAKWVLI